MTYKTQGIVLRAVKYGETSLIVSVFTEMFGSGSYIINGVRTEKSGGGKASLYQPGEWLALELYHSEGKSLNRIKEASRFYLFQNNQVDVLRHSSVLFMMELLNKCLKHPEKNPELFGFCTRSLVNLDGAAQKNIPDIMLRFALRLPQFLGYGIIPPAETDYENGNPDEAFHLDLHDGSFSYSLPEHPYCLSGREAKKAASLLDDSETSMAETKVNYSVILEKISEFYTLHNPEFGKMRTLSFLQEMIS